MQLLPNNAKWIEGHLSPAEQEALLGDIRQIVAKAPLYTPTMPRTGKAMRVQMTNCGALGWVTDKHEGYRYQSFHPVTAKPWPAMPPRLLSMWRELAGYPHDPEACLINYYGPEAKMGLHQDRDEEDFKAPVLSISLGDACRFRIGGATRSGGTASIRLSSGDIVLLTGRSRLAYHGVDRIYPGTSGLLKGGGRINLTLRRVTRPD